MNESIPGKIVPMIGGSSGTGAATAQLPGSRAARVAVGARET